MPESRGSEWEIATVIQYPETGREEVYVACQDGWRRDLFAKSDTPCKAKILYTWEDACQIANRLEDVSGRKVWVRMAHTNYRKEWANTWTKRKQLREAEVKAKADAAEARRLFALSDCYQI